MPHSQAADSSSPAVEAGSLRCSPAQALPLAARSSLQAETPLAFAVDRPRPSACRRTAARPDSPRSNRRRIGPAPRARELPERWQAEAALEHSLRGSPAPSTFPKPRRASATATHIHRPNSAGQQSRIEPAQATARPQLPASTSIFGFGSTCWSPGCVVGLASFRRHSGRVSATARTPARSLRAAASTWHCQRAAVAVCSGCCAQRQPRAALPAQAATQFGPQQCRHLFGISQQGKKVAAFIQAA